MKRPFEAYHAAGESSDISEADGAGPSEVSSYEYTPLEQGEIRVLILLEADELHDDLECALSTLSLDRFTTSGNGEWDRFTALSYVWGESKKTRRVYIDDKSLLISKNLDSALRHLRRRDRQILLWVDAICINQSDLRERNHQVQQMRDIFECAHETIAYLGDHDQGNVAESAWNFLERHSTWALNEDLDQDLSVPRKREDQIHFRGDLHDVYYTILTRPWFERVWVFQEAVVSKRLSIQSRHRRVPWDDFVKCTILQSREHDRYGQSLGQERGFDFVRQLWQARVSFHAGRGQGHYLPTWYAEHMDPLDDSLSTDLLDMLRLARPRQASDPRDKVFALLGISTGLDWHSNNTVDYGKTTAQVYKDFAIDYMTFKNDFRVLSYLNRITNPGYVHREAKRLIFRRYGIKDISWNSSTAAKQHKIYSSWFAEEPQQTARKPTEPPAYNHSSDERLRVLAGAIIRGASQHSSTTDEHRRDASDPTDDAVESESDAKISDGTGEDGDGAETWKDSEDDSSEEEDLEKDDRFRYLPSWVPDWDSTDQTSRPARAIIEIADPLPKWKPTTPGGVHDPESARRTNLESLRTWTTGYSPEGQAIPMGTLVVQGRVLGKVARGMSATSLLGKDESRFRKLQTRWEGKRHTLLFPIEAYILSLWSNLLEQTWTVEPTRLGDTGDVAMPSLVPPNSIEAELSGNPYERMIPEFNLGSLPAKATSIEAQLIERARRCIDWSTDSAASERVVGRRSIVDNRLLGYYRTTDLEQDIAIEASAVNQEAGKLILLPPDMKFGDLVVMFPGAEVPFLVRRKWVCGIHDDSIRHLNSENLPHIRTAKLHVECTLVGECWVNGFAEMTEGEQVFDTVFSVQ